MINRQENQGTKSNTVRITVKTNDLYGSSYASAPLNYWQNVKYLSKTTNNLCSILFPYFSSETGRKKQHKEITITELRATLGTDGKVTSRSALETAIKEINKFQFFLVNEAFNGREKMYTFYVNNEKNQEIFENVRQGKGTFKQGVFEYYQENNVINIEKPSLNFGKRSLFFSNENNLNVETCRKKVNVLQKKVNVENAETIENTTQEPINEKSQDYYIKDNLYKDYYLTSSKNDATEKKESENKKQASEVVFKNLNGVKEEKTPSESKNILLNFGVTRENTSNFDQLCKLPKEFILESISTVNNKINVTSPRGFLISLLKKVPAENKTVTPGDAVPVKKLSATHDVESKIIDFFHQEDLLPIKESVTALDESLISLVNFKDDYEFMEKFKALGISKSDLVQVFKGRAGFPSGFGEKIRELLAGY